VLTARDLRLVFGQTVALANVSVTVSPGEVISLTGPSGSGKSSLLYCLSGIVAPTQGTVSFDGTDITRASQAELSRLRRERFGFVFQFAELVPELTLRENVALPLELLRTPRRERLGRVEALLERLGILAQADRRPAQVSGGQAQRAAVARALVHRPAVVFADEPTGSLDSLAGQIVLQALLELADESDSAVIFATHDASVAASATRRVVLQDGLVVDRTAMVAS